MKKALEVKNEKEVWEIVNRERIKKKGISTVIEMGEWTMHFRMLLEGAEKRMLVEMERGGGEGGEQEAEIEKKKIRKVLRGLKEGKATGTDGIPNEVLKYGREKWRNGLRRFVIECRMEVNG